MTAADTLTKRYLSPAEVADLYASREVKTYQKRGTFLARYAEPDETILTIVAGKLETLAAAKWGDVVVMNIEIGSSVERYLVAKDMFEKRYELTERTITTDGHSWMLVNAKGRVRAWQYEGPSVTFEAPWGESMLLEEGDWIASPVGGEPDDIYRIEREAFAGTYRLLEE
jgi:hypothetical protein